MSEKELIALAEKAREYAYCPYSGYSVGAALLTEKGDVYLGCNIENTSFSLTQCAERTAIFKAVSEGSRSFTAIAIVGGKHGEKPDDLCPPCGACRQVLCEFCSGELRIILGNSNKYEVHTLTELIPLCFKFD